MEHSLYHSLLRIAALSVAVVLAFDSGVLLPVTQELSHNAQQYVASAVGVNASVTPNEVNQLTADLTARQQELARREAQLQEREIAVGLNTDGDGDQTNLSTYFLSAILFILLVLILLNYLLDFLRQTRGQQSMQAS